MVIVLASVMLKPGHVLLAQRQRVVEPARFQHDAGKHDDHRGLRWKQAPRC